ncbi:hypothetical protein L1049_013185 [Liquidambar formosana]|uniref:Uncharacterized protein n=1 Tax=Liquidambar formosana TaxID=63359 RepID=A0AAP0WWQ3_LIQFO
MRVRKDSMDRDEIVENVAMTIGRVVEIVQKKWGSGGKKDEKLGSKKGSKKRTTHEVRYMDSNADDLMDANEFGSDDDEDIGELGGVEFEGKKRKKGDLIKEQVNELN